MFANGRNGSSSVDDVVVFDLQTEATVFRQSMDDLAQDLMATTDDSAVFLGYSGLFHQLLISNNNSFVVNLWTAMNESTVAAAFGFDGRIYASSQEWYCKLNSSSGEILSYFLPGGSEWAAAIFPVFQQGASFWWLPPACVMVIPTASFNATGVVLTPYCAENSNSASESVSLQFMGKWALLPMVGNNVIVDAQTVESAFLLVPSEALMKNLPDQLQNPVAVILGSMNGGFQSNNPSISNSSICVFSSQPSAFVQNLLSCGPISSVDQSRTAQISPFALPDAGSAPLWKPAWSVKKEDSTTFSLKIVILKITCNRTVASQYLPLCSDGTEVSVTEFLVSPVIVNDLYVIAALGRHRESSGSFSGCSMRIFDLRNGGLVFASNESSYCDTNAGEKKRKERHVVHSFF